MNCALCGVRPAALPSIICSICAEARSERIREKTKFLEVYSHVRQALESAQRYLGEYPDSGRTWIVTDAQDDLEDLLPALARERDRLAGFERHEDELLSAGHTARDAYYAAERAKRKEA